MYRRTATIVAAALLATGMAAAGTASARDSFSVAIGLPGVAVGFSNGGAYGAVALPAPYTYPRPAYVAPYPYPAPVYAPAPVFVAPPFAYRPYWPAYYHRRPYLARYRHY